MAQDRSISMPTTPMYPTADGSLEGKKKKGFRSIFSFGKKKDASLGESRSGSESGLSGRVEEEGQRSSRRSFAGIFKRPKNKPAALDYSADNLIDSKVSITDNAQQAEDGDEKEHGLMGRIKKELHIHTNRHSESAPKEERKPSTQLDHHAGNANKHELKKTGEAEVRDHAVKDPSPAAHGEGKKLAEKEGKNDHHHHLKDDGEATTKHEPEGEKKPEDAIDHPVESNGCETLGKGLQRVCLPWTLNKDE